MDLTQLVTGLLLAIGVCSAACKLFEFIAKRTPNTKDDEYSSKATKVVETAYRILYRLSLNPKDKGTSK